jgi:hypothetical protein
VRILFTSMSARSHIAPMLPVARTVANAGHEVVFATAPDAIAELPRGQLRPGLHGASARLGEQILSMPTPPDPLGRLEALVAGDSHCQSPDVTVADAASTVGVASFGVE